MTAEEFKTQIKDEIGDATLDAPIDAWWTYYFGDGSKGEFVTYLWTRWKALNLARSKAVKLVDTTTGGDSVKASQYAANLKDLIKDAWTDIEIGDPAQTPGNVGSFKSTQALNDQYKGQSILTGEGTWPGIYPPGWDQASVGGTF